MTNSHSGTLIKNIFAMKGHKNVMLINELPKQKNTFINQFTLKPFVTLPNLLKVDGEK